MVLRWVGGGGRRVSQADPTPTFTHPPRFMELIQPMVKRGAEAETQRTRRQSATRLRCAEPVYAKSN